MGLFGFIKKAVGKVAGAGLSLITHGASDKVLKAFKGSAGSKSPKQQDALIAKVTAPTPKVKQTESRIEGWGFGRESYGGGKRMPGRAKARTRVAPQDRYTPPPAPIRKRKDRARMPAAARSGAKRAAPKGGLDLKKLGAMYTAAGKQAGTGLSWQQFIQANKGVRT